MYVLLVSGCFLPFSLFFYLYSRFACLHDASNHGARCFDHLLGLFYLRSELLFTTPASCASDIKKASILLVRRSLLCLYFSVMSSNAAANVSVDVCAFHMFAL